MRDFNRRDNRGGGRDFGRRDFDRPQEMHKAICSNCGKDCEVPFRPSGTKPVLCRECFQKSRGESGNFPRRDNFNDRSNDSRRSEVTPQTNYNQQFESLNNKLDRILSLLNEKVELKVPVEATPTENTNTDAVAGPIKKRKRVVKEILPQETPTE